jgi:hypothetical protein
MSFFSTGRRGSSFLFSSSANRCSAMTGSSLARSR